jgi:prophage antirepressor-like protein
MAIGEKMSNLIPFPDPNAMHRIIGKMFGQQEVRTAVKRDNTIWFVLTDVCNVLGIQNTTQVGNRLRDSQKAELCITDISSNGVEQRRNVIIISESGLYSVILKSRSKKAEPFQTWVEDEVLPSIRAKGNYFAAEAPKDPLANFRDQIPGNLADALMLAGTAMKRADHAEQELKIAKPKVAALERIAESKGALCMRDAAKTLQMRPIDFREYLAAKKWIFRGSGIWVAFQDKINTGYLELKEHNYSSTDGDDRVSPQVRVTNKGLVKLAKMLAEDRLQAELNLNPNDPNNAA